LIKLGVNTNAIHRQTFDNSTENRLRLIGYVVSEKMVILPEYKVAYFTITAEELKKYNSQTGDTEGIANQGLSINGIVLSVLMVERPDGIKMSFRSVEEFAANEVATKYFNGGGHKNAAGGKMTTGGLEGTLKKLLKILPEYKEQLLGIA
jgi:phosphoesterase RecJ-like protein